jgi:ribosome biogenesis GTPase A
MSLAVRVVPSTKTLVYMRRNSEANVCFAVLQLMVHYGLPEFANINEFLALLAKRRGMLRKGGVPDINKAAKIVLQDWNM